MGCFNDEKVSCSVTTSTDLPVFLQICHPLSECQIKNLKISKATKYIYKFFLKKNIKVRRLKGITKLGLRQKIP